MAPHLSRGEGELKSYRIMAMIDSGKESTRNFAHMKFPGDLHRNPTHRIQRVGIMFSSMNNM